MVQRLRGNLGKTVFGHDENGGREAISGGGKLQQDRFTSSIWQKQCRYQRQALTSGACMFLTVLRSVAISCPQNAPHATHKFRDLLLNTRTQPSFDQTDDGVDAETSLSFFLSLHFYLSSLPFSRAHYWVNKYILKMRVSSKELFSTLIKTIGLGRGLIIKKIQIRVRVRRALPREAACFWNGEIDVRRSAFVWCTGGDERELGKGGKYVKDDVS